MIEIAIPALESIDPVLEIMNFVLAIAGIFLVADFYKILEGNLKSAWRYILVTILLFGVHEIVGILEESNMFAIDGLYTLTEFIFVIAFFVALFAFRKLFISISKNKFKKG
jgi:hypothetical protein